MNKKLKSRSFKREAFLPYNVDADDAEIKTWSLNVKDLKLEKDRIEFLFTDDSIEFSASRLDIMRHLKKNNKVLLRTTEMESFALANVEFEVNKQKNINMLIKYDPIYTKEKSSAFSKFKREIRRSEGILVRGLQVGNEGSDRALRVTVEHDQPKLMAALQMGGFEGKGVRGVRGDVGDMLTALGDGNGEGEGLMEILELNDRLAEVVGGDGVLEGEGSGEGSGVALAKLFKALGVDGTEEVPLVEYMPGESKYDGRTMGVGGVRMKLFNRRGEKYVEFSGSKSLGAKGFSAMFAAADGETNEDVGDIPIQMSEVTMKEMIERLLAPAGAVADREYVGEEHRLSVYSKGKGVVLLDNERIREVVKVKKNGRIVYKVILKKGLEVDRLEEGSESYEDCVCTVDSMMYHGE